MFYESSTMYVVELLLITPFCYDVLMGQGQSNISTAALVQGYLVVSS